MEMDELTDTLASAFGVTSNSNDPSRPHPRLAFYKNKEKEVFSFQEIRRRRTLDVQKKRRDDFLSVARALLTGQTEDNYDEDSLADVDYMDESAWTESTTNNHEGKAEEKDVSEKENSYLPENVDKLLKHISLKQNCRNQLMLSEWLVDIPSNLETDWVAMPVPEGRRCLIIAGDGQTKHFTKSGAFINKFPSFLPGGSFKFKKSGDVTILDCIFSQIAQTYYILDCMVWAGISYYNCDTEFRAFWASSKVSETEGLGSKSRQNPFIFKILPTYPCTKESLTNTFGEESHLEFDPLPIDGILFYHKRVCYLPGVTPLVGWLKPYMLPEILNVPVSKKILDQRPSNYLSMSKFIQDFDAEVNNRPAKHQCTEKVQKC